MTTATIEKEITEEELQRLLGKTAWRALRPPPKLSLSEWADREFYLSTESSAGGGGKWHTLPYQKGWMDAITDPSIWMVSVKKSARVGYTKSINAAVGYHVDHNPCSQMLVLPTIDGAKVFSKEEIDPMFRDCPKLRPLTTEREDSDKKDTLLHIRYPGGVLSLAGANSGAGLRSISRRVVIFDEVDAFPPSAGEDGDPIRLGIKRAEYFHDRKVIAGSTPLVEGRSRISTLFEDGDQRYYFVPCPQCGHMAPLVFRGNKGHVLTWHKGQPETAFFGCQARGCVIEHSSKLDMIERGEWRATAEGSRDASGRLHASFHIWAAYSYSPNASWAHLAAEWESAQKEGPNALRMFVNTALGETWKEQGEAPDWEKLYARREKYPLATVPPGALFLTAFVDVQQDRFIYEVVGWGYGKESWSVDAGVIPGNPSNEADWLLVDELLGRAYPTPDGGVMQIRMMGVDSSYNTNAVYSWCRRHPMSRVIATKGRAEARSIISVPSKTEVTIRGKAIGFQVWIVGTDIAKAELYGWLRLPSPPDGLPAPPGFCHFPEHGEEFFKQLTAEHLVTSRNKKGVVKTEWLQLPNRENHWLDCRIGNRAVSMLIGLDRLASPPREHPLPVAAPVSAPVPAPAAPAPSAPEKPASLYGRRTGGWLHKPRK